MLSYYDYTATEFQNRLFISETIHMVDWQTGQFTEA